MDPNSSNSTGSGLPVQIPNNNVTDGHLPTDLPPGTKVDVVHNADAENISQNSNSSGSDQITPPPHTRGGEQNVTIQPLNGDNPANPKRDKHNACLPKAIGPTFTTDGLFAPRYTWTRNQTTASSSRVPGNSTQQRTSIAYPPSIPRIPGSDLHNSPTDPKAPVDTRNIVDMDTFRNHAAQTNANMAQMHSRMHLAVSDAPVIDRVIEETRRTPFTDRIARFRIRDLGRLRFPEFRKELTVRQPVTLDDALHKALHFAKAEEELPVLALRFKKSKTQNAPLAIKKPFKKENQTQGQHTLFAIEEAAEDESPELDLRKYCKYHKKRGHSTEECCAVKKLIAVGGKTKKGSNPKVETPPPDEQEEEQTLKQKKRDRTPEGGDSPPPTRRERIDLVFAELDLRTMKAVPSTYHQCIKFPLDKGITVVYSSQRRSRKCYMGSYEHIKKADPVVLMIEDKLAEMKTVRSSDPSQRGPRKSLITQVCIDESDPKRCVGIGQDLDLAIRENLITFLKEKETASPGQVQTSEE
ncbi:hypothetical protein ISN44_Un120g000040 [Arabidopsis suecica]|uniref:Uncharacterized protein n=1 Tax=Arabidopsis suecica TaxID=45249 RepID=A0A8T1XAR7_ARASU|nr:hypothetical protein ISN44_Un120g000040 [Arabidopsis suecica]